MPSEYSCAFILCVLHCCMLFYSFSKGTNFSMHQAKLNINYYKIGTKVPRSFPLRSKVNISKLNWCCLLGSQNFQEATFLTHSSLCLTDIKRYIVISKDEMSRYNISTNSIRGEKIHSWLDGHLASTAVVLKQLNILGSNKITEKLSPSYSVFLLIPHFHKWVYIQDGLTLYL